jgi:hypothetical protein
MRMFNVFAAFLLAAFVAGVGCKSTHEEGVKSNLHTQWTEVPADTKTATAIAEEVLEGEGLKEVSSKATAVDGKASGKMADETKVVVTVEKKGETSSQVSVNVGKLGDPKVGAEIARKIKMRAMDKNATAQ